MTKLVEEFNVESEVLANALVKSGLVDEKFMDGNVARIEVYHGLDGVNTYNITVEKEVSLKDIEIKDSKELVGFDYMSRPIYAGNNNALSSEQLNKVKEVSNKNDEGRNEVDERDDLDKIVDLLAYLKESVDILNAERCTAEKFAQEFMERIKTIKGGF